MLPVAEPPGPAEDDRTAAGESYKAAGGSQFQMAGERAYSAVLPAEAAIGFLRFPIRSRTREPYRGEWHAGRQFHRCFPAQAGAVGPRV